MDYNQLIILVCIGLAAGILSGFTGIGGGIVMVPAFILFMGMSQFQAQGTSLAVMLPPIGIMALYNYHKAGNVHINFAIVVAIAFVLGGFIGSKLSLKMNPNLVRFIFGILMLYVAGRMIWSSSIKLFANGQ